VEGGLAQERVAGCVLHEMWLPTGNFGWLHAWQLRAWQLCAWQLYAWQLCAWQLYAWQLCLAMLVTNACTPKLLTTQLPRVTCDLSDSLMN